MVNGRRRNFIRTVGTISVAGLAGCIGGDGDGNGTGGEEEITIVTADFAPESHPIVQGANKYFVDEVEKRTDGRVQFETHFGGSLGDAGDMVELIQNRTADMGNVAPGIQSDILPLSGFGNLPGTFDSAEAGSEAFYDIYMDDVYEAEPKELGLRPLVAGMIYPYQVGGKGEKIEADEDWEGLNVRSGGGMMSITLEHLGASPVEMAGGESYQALDRGTVDATVFGPLSTVAYDLHELIDYHTTNLHLGSFGVTLMMNHDFFDDLPSDIQDVLVAVGRDASLNLGQTQDTQSKDAEEKMSEAGVDVYEVDEETATRWSDDLIDVVGSEWADQIDDEKAEELVNKWREMW